MLTYLDRTSSQHLGQCAHGLAAVGIMAHGALAIQIATRLSPCQVVHDGEALSPENGGAVGHGQNTRVDETFQRRRPFLVRAEG
jgi:hypothetical protein